jgi:hypothetical protein
LEQVVYTALFGSYESLVEQPLSAQSSCDFLCFTDDPTLTSQTWKIVHTEPSIPLDPVRSARHIKIVGHDALEGYQESLWIDNRIVLKKSPESLLRKWLHSNDIALISHSGRASVRAEFAAVLHWHLDDPARVREQLSVMEAIAPTVLDEVPYWSAIIARRNSARVNSAMRIWMDFVLRYSRRDQLSFNYTIQKQSLPVEVLELDNRQSEWHEWLTAKQLPKDKRQRYGSFFKYGLGAHLIDAATTNRLVRNIRWRLLRLGINVD